MKLQQDLEELITLYSQLVAAEPEPPVPKKKPAPVQEATHPSSPKKEALPVFNKIAQPGPESSEKVVGDQVEKKKKSFQAGKKEKKPNKKEAEQNQKQSAWLNFAKGGGVKKKSGTSKPSLLSKKSMFATPDNPKAVVGVIGSGQGMTQFQQRGKHTFSKNEYQGTNE